MVKTSVLNDCLNAINKFVAIYTYRVLGKH
jgi:hypothetical protein